ncbi:GGDEF domain-containing protein [Lysobacter sp. CFH 32150]|uniref:GGDEF domain-containing protein n=1 Tax=Lysobacter sp. CFH 32150 TaxID=2927128 RepID=UPI001FA6D330|nr:GGDEF domain-containing protein [Lysobacter sp. CFH 32150]MCI4568185.1 GGDEF domain-containing protein [Lysobacter sp. CFH 32150]
MREMQVYRALSKVFPHSFRAKLMAVVLVCTMLPIAVFTVWLLANNGADPRRLLTGTVVAVLITLLGTAVSLLLIFQLLAPLRLVADAIGMYFSERKLPVLPEGGEDEIGVLMRATHCGLQRIHEGVAELERYAVEDPLTHAMNRRGSEQALAHSIELAELGMVPLVLYVIDVDNLKPVNDVYGHAAGDQMLFDLVDRTRDWLVGHDWIGRWGGDEFLLCMHEALPVANAKVQRWLDDLAAPGEDGIVIRISAGCAHYQPGLTAMALYREADAAMYVAKAAGGGKLVCHGHPSERELVHQ